MAAKPDMHVKSDKRLYVGNLSTSVDEYSLMQLCSKLGRIAKLDYLFHKTGPQKGKPRGYAFVEYSSAEEAKRAQQTLHDRLFRGRKMMVSFASEQQEVAPTGTTRPRGPVSNDAQKPTAISLLKGGGVTKAPVNRKIAALEAKLAAMRQSKDGTASGSATASPAGSATPPPVGAGAGAAQEGGAEASGSGRAGASATANINHAAAGLPNRPYFTSSEAPREM
ncbi:hypothetical protein JCM3775_004052 [Rhodotorula graminis]|uniref:Probable RNA-binding protein 18 n=1 Tax=Rhodotorula graminis (strain WP1) TaxID=578459 RepID=A0A0P9GYZ8_RHOGW|nr:uncharacterized protein RHOBADRAFT_55699 [Rhodotorula graminis WP1]KPV72602.1 hypothetical protein RHOBADRAFT_55699 [Rhodotorula graminis WP1]